MILKDTHPISWFFHGKAQLLSMILNWHLLEIFSVSLLKKPICELKLQICLDKELSLL